MKMYLIIAIIIVILLILAILPLIFVMKKDKIYPKLNMHCSKVCATNDNCAGPNPVYYKHCSYK
jgi:hypothetical protein